MDNSNRKSKSVLLSIPGYSEGDETVASTDVTDTTEADFISVVSEEEGDWDTLPRLSHQTVQNNVSGSGFQTIYGRTTKPIYSKVDLKALVSTQGVPREQLELPLAQADSPLSKIEEFQSIYGQLKRTSKDGGQSDEQRAGKGNYETATQSNFIRTLIRPNLYRLVIAASHEEDEEKLIEWTRDAIDDINSHSYSENVTGTLIIYPNHFIHVLEGPEDALMKFLRVNADQFESMGEEWKLEFKGGVLSTGPPILFNTVKATVIGMFGIKQRTLNVGWKTERVGATPLKMSEDEIPPGPYSERVFHFAKQCIIAAITLNKMNTLKPPKKNSHRVSGGSGQANTSTLNPKDKKRKKASGKFMKPIITQLGHLSPTSANEKDDSREKYEEHKRRRSQAIHDIIPKPPMIDYIIKKNEKRKLQLRSIREHIRHFFTIPQIVFDEELEWPIPGKLAPYN